MSSFKHPFQVLFSSEEMNIPSMLTATLGLSLENFRDSTGSSGLLSLKLGVSTPSVSKRY